MEAPIEVINSRHTGAGGSRCPPSLTVLLDFLKAHTKPGQVWRQSDLSDEVDICVRTIGDMRRYGAGRPYTCKVVSKSLGVTVGERVWGLPETIERIVKAKQGRRP